MDPVSTALRPLRSLGTHAAYRQLVSGSFHLPSEVLFSFRSRYYCTIGRPGVISLGGWSPRIHTRFLVTGDTWDDYGRFISFDYRALTFCGWPSHAIHLDMNFVTPWALAVGPVGPSTPV